MFECFQHTRYTSWRSQPINAGAQEGARSRLAAYVCLLIFMYLNCGTFLPRSLASKRPLRLLHPPLRSPCASSSIEIRICGEPRPIWSRSRATEARRVSLCESRLGDLVGHSVRVSRLQEEKYRAEGNAWRRARWARDAPPQQGHILLGYSFAMIFLPRAGCYNIS